MSKRGARNSANVKPGQFNPDPEAQLEVQRQESDARPAAPGTSTGASIKWLRIGKLRIPCGFSLGLSLSGKFGPGRKRQTPSRQPDPREKVWDSETGTFKNSR